jgi:hypothetical protein
VIPFYYGFGSGSAKVRNLITVQVPLWQKVTVPTGSGFGFGTATLLEAAKKCIRKFSVKFALILFVFSSGRSGGGLESADPATGREGGGHGRQGHQQEE